MNLQRANTWREIDDVANLLRLQRFHQGMNAKTQIEIEHQRTILDQQIIVTGDAIGHADMIAIVFQAMDDGIAEDAGRNVWRFLLPLRQCRDHFFLFHREGQRLRQGQFFEAYFVARLELADLPQFGFHDHGGAHEATQARPIGTQNDRHIAGEIDGADRVGIVMNIRRMQPRLATVAARPLWFRPNQAHAGAAGVVMHFPIGGEEHVHIRIGKKIG